MVFLIQRARNKDFLVLHPKLNELIAATKGASNLIINAQYLPENETQVLHKFYCLLAEMTKTDNTLGKTYSVEEAESNHEYKQMAQRDDKEATIKKGGSHHRSRLFLVLKKA